jgi:hypothetical protein
VAQIGLARYLRVSRTLKKESRALYEGVLRADVKSPQPDIDIFTFANRSRIGIFYIDPNDALTVEQQLRSLWIEFDVDDEPATVAGLQKLGLRPFEHFNNEPKYFQAPGGQVFGIAQRDNRALALSALPRQSTREGGSHEQFAHPEG